MFLFLVCENTPPNSNKLVSNLKVDPGVVRENIFLYKFATGLIKEYAHPHVT
jgi:hypothetical protein